MNKAKKITLAIGMIVLGIAMLVIGAVGQMLPPALTGMGFLLIAWAHAGR